MVIEAPHGFAAGLAPLKMASQQVDGGVGGAIFVAVPVTLGVYLHGLAGERVRDTLGDTGMVASDLLPVLPTVIRDLR